MTHTLDDDIITGRNLCATLMQRADQRGDRAALNAAGEVLRLATETAISILHAFEAAATAPPASAGNSVVVPALDDPQPDPIKTPPETITPPRLPPRLVRAPSPPASDGPPVAAPKPTFPKQPPRMTGPDPTDYDIPI